MGLSPLDTAIPSVGRSKTAVIAAARAEEASSLHCASSSLEGGHATLIHDTGTLQEPRPDVRHVMSGSDVGSEAKGWSPLRRAVGHFFVEMGVHGGCEGRLFDFSAATVEEIITSGEDPSLSSAKPLLSLAVIGCHALRTLAQHATVEMLAEWVEAANDVAGLVRLACTYCSPEMEDREESRPMVRSLLHGLDEMYQTLGQCEDGGYVARQLSIGYDEALRVLLRQQWAEQMARLRSRVSTDVVELVLTFRKHHDQLGRA